MLVDSVPGLVGGGIDVLQRRSSMVDGIGMVMGDDRIYQDISSGITGCLGVCDVETEWGG